MMAEKEKRARAQGGSSKKRTRLYDSFELIDPDGEEVKVAKKETVGIRNPIAKSGVGQEKGSSSLDRYEGGRAKPRSPILDPQESATDPLDVAFQHATELQRRNTDLMKRVSQLEIEKKTENEEMTRHLREMHCELGTKIVENKAFKEELTQLKVIVGSLSTDKEAFLQERRVMKTEYVKLLDQLAIAQTDTEATGDMKKRCVELQDQLAIVTAEAQLYKEDFDNERRDRVKAHDSREEMRIASDRKVRNLEETIQLLTRQLEGAGDTQQDELAMKVVKLNNEVKRLQDDLYKTHQEAQEEVQAKTIQVKRYKEKDDHREEKLTQLEVRNKELEVRNKELAQEMERVRSEIEKTKTECAKTIKEEKKLSQKEMERVRQELEKARKKLAHQKMSKSEAHEELLRVQQDNESLRAYNETLNESLVKVEEHFARLKQRHLELKKKATMNTPNQILQLEAKNQELVKDMEKMKAQNGQGRDNESLRKTVLSLKTQTAVLSQNKEVTDFGTPEYHCPLTPLPLHPQESPTNGQNMPLFLNSNQPLKRSSTVNQQRDYAIKHAKPVVYKNSPQGFNQDYPRQDQWGQGQSDSGPSQWVQQAQYGQPEPHHLYQQQGTVQPRPHYNQTTPPLSQYDHPQQQDHYNVRPTPAAYWESKQPRYGHHHVSADEPIRQQSRNEAFDYQRRSSVPVSANSLKQSPIPRPRNSLSETGPDPNTYSTFKPPLDPSPKPKPKPKPRKRSVSPHRENATPHNQYHDPPSENDDAPKGLVTEIQEMASNVLFHQNESDKQDTNELAPFDPNLVCPMCDRKYRIGEIQKFRKHILNNCESAVAGNEATDDLGTDTKPFTIQH